MIKYLRIKMGMKTLFIIIAILVLPGCATSPVIQTVDKNQDYEMPERFIIHGIGDATREEIADKCDGNINGCLIPQGHGIYIMYFTAENVKEHEFDHLIFGEAHN